MFLCFQHLATFPEMIAAISQELPVEPEIYPVSYYFYLLSEALAERNSLSMVILRRRLLRAYIANIERKNRESSTAGRFSCSSEDSFLPSETPPSNSLPIRKDPLDGFLGSSQ